MNRRIRQVFLFASMSLLCATLVLAQTTITFLHVNDTHSHLDADGPKDHHLHGTIGGIARAAAIIGSVRTTEKNVVLLHGGDAFVGDFFYNKYFGVPELQLMSSLGFDAMAVGNHEFDLTPDALTDALEAAKPTFPLLSANLIMGGYARSAELQQFVQSSTMIHRGGVNIGIFGMTVPTSPLTNAAPIIIDTNVGPIAYQMAAGLRAAGADIVICLSHLGFLYDQGIAAGVPGIDVIVGAHDHYLFDQPVRVTNPGGSQTLILQAGEFYEHIGELQLTVDNGVVTFAGYKMISLDGHVHPVAVVQETVNQLKSGIEATYGDVYHKVLAVALSDINRHFDPASPLRDTPLGNLITDACRRKAETQLGITALGLTSEKIYAGPIVGADVFRAVPFGFDPQTGLGVKLVTFQIQGSELVKGIEMTLAYLEYSEDFFLQVSGMSYRYDATQPPGQRLILNSVRIGGKPVDLSATYSVAGDEGLANSLPLLGVVTTNLEILPVNEYTVLKEFIDRHRFIDYRPEGRIRDISVKCRAEHDMESPDIAQANAGANSRLTVSEFALAQNYPNPFNPTTTISYAVPAPSHVIVDIYNCLGQLVKTLVDGNVAQGLYDVRWDASAVASGVYFCRMTATGSSGGGTFTATRRLLFVR